MGKIPNDIVCNAWYQHPFYHFLDEETNETNFDENNHDCSNTDDKGTDDGKDVTVDSNEMNDTVSIQTTSLPATFPWTLLLFLLFPCAFSSVEIHGTQPP